MPNRPWDLVRPNNGDHPPGVHARANPGPDCWPGTTRGSPARSLADEPNKAGRLLPASRTSGSDDWAGEEELEAASAAALVAANRLDDEADIDLSQVYVTRGFEERLALGLLTGLAPDSPRARDSPDTSGSSGWNSSWANPAPA